MYFTLDCAARKLRYSLSQILYERSVQSTHPDVVWFQKRFLLPARMVGISSSVSYFPLKVLVMVTSPPPLGIFTDQPCAVLGYGYFLDPHIPVQQLEPGHLEKKLTIEIEIENSGWLSFGKIRLTTLFKHAGNSSMKKFKPLANENNISL